jgi:hypothetical protein
MTILLDVTPVSTGLEIFAGLAFLLIFAGIALVVFKLLKRTVKMAVRMTIAGLILAIAVIGSLYFFFSGPSKAPRPPVRTAPAR